MALPVKLAAALVVGIAAVLAVAVTAVAIHNRVTFGTFYTTGAPPRVDWCGRRYYPGTSGNSFAYVYALPATDGHDSLSRIGSTPAGLPIVAYVMTPAERASYHTNVCTMGVFVQVGADNYVPYGLSGGP